MNGPALLKVTLCHAHWLEIKQCYHSSPLCSFSYKKLTYAATPVSIIRTWKQMWFFYNHYAYLIHYIGTEVHQNSDYPRWRWRTKYRKELAWGKAWRVRRPVNLLIVIYPEISFQYRLKGRAHEPRYLIFFFFFIVYIAFGTSPVSQW